MSETRYCLRCGARITEDMSYCGRCGYPTKVYLIENPPKIRVTYRLGFLVFILGLIPHIFVNYMIDLLHISFTRDILYTLVYLDDILFLPLLVLGIIFLFSTFSKLILKPWLIDIIVVIGFSAFILTIYLVQNASLQYTILYMYVRSISYFLIIGGVLSRKMVDEEIERLNAQINDTKGSYLLAFITVLISLSYFFSLPLRILLSTISVGIITWLVWDVYTPRITLSYIFKNIKGRKEDWMEVIQIKDRLNWRELKPHYVNLLLKSFTPILMSFSILAFTGEIFPFLDIEMNTVEGIAKSIKYSLMLITIFSIFVSSTQWLFDVLDLRIYDKREKIVEKASIIGYLDSFIDVFALISFLITMYRVASTQVEKVTGVALVYYSITSTFFLFLLYWIILLPTSMLATLLYFVFSMKKHINIILRLLNPRRI